MQDYTLTLHEPDKIRQGLRRNEAWLCDACGSALAAQGGLVARKTAAVLGRWIEQGKPLALEQDQEWSQGISPWLLPALARAYQREGEEHYAHDARRVYEVILDHEPWHRDWRPETKPHPLILPHRLGATECVGWMGALPALLDSDAFDDELLLAIIRSAVAQLDYLAANLHAGRNIRLTQADALLHQSLRLSFLPQAGSWRELAVHVLNDGWHRLIAPDGASREATAWYHHILVEMGLRLWRLQQADVSLGLKVGAAQLAAMLDYSLACIEPDGRSLRMGDSVGDITPDGTLASFIVYRRACLEAMGQPAGLPAPAQHFEHVNQAMIRSDWSDKADLLAFDATTRHGHHWHPGRNSLQLVVAGQRVLADVGRMTYRPTAHRRYATSTRGHSTVNFNGWDQADTPAVLRHHHTDSWHALDGDYQGGYWPWHEHEYGRGLYARHQRTVLWRIDRFLLVIDHLSHTAGEVDKPRMEMLWHFAPGEVKVIDPRTVHARCGRSSLHLHTLLCPQDARLMTFHGSHDPVLGWMADDATDQPRPAPSVMLQVERLERWRTSFATLLVPAGDGKSPAQVERVVGHDVGDRPCAHVMIHWCDGRRDAFWWTHHLAAALDDSVEGIRTDASLLHLSYGRDGEASHVMMLDGSHARRHDGALLFESSGGPGFHAAALR